MHDRSWFGMDGMSSSSSYWIPILLVVIAVVLLWGFSRRRSRRDR